jgi:two-component system nitrogen regulation response regulator NtrX
MNFPILIVDDESGIRHSLCALLRDEGYDSDAVSSGEECLQATRKKRYSLIFLDVWLKGMDGIEVLGQLQRQDAPPMTIMISGHASIETAVRATKLGAFNFIEKPLSLEKVILAVRNAVEFSRLEEENRRLRGELEERFQLLGDSVPMKALRQQIALTAPTNGRVLIYGESGTGKELIAHALHLQSQRSNGPFVEVNCAAIPEELIESELFGHRKGSFTGASEDKAGKFQRADEGTIFLDEVADMSLKTQAKVLRVLEQQSVEPVGASNPIAVDVRVIAATNKRLEEEIARGAFREDLFYRLNVIPFVVPPLRERKPDIPVLARHFLGEFSRKYSRGAREFSPEAVEVLMRYGWPGNVRELKNLVERLVIITLEERIEPHHLPPEIFRGGGRGDDSAATLGDARAAYERDFILRKLEENQWNMTRTAAAVGLERSHLYRKMKSLGIASPRPNGLT